MSANFSLPIPFLKFSVAEKYLTIKFEHAFWVGKYTQHIDYADNRFIISAMIGKIHSVLKYSEASFCSWLKTAHIFKLDQVLIEYFKYQIINTYKSL